MPWGRVGSNLVMAYLRSILKGKFANEPLNQIKGVEAQSDYLQDFFSDTQDEPDACLKITIRSIEDLEAAQSILNDQDVFVIKMYRCDHVKTVVSQIRAEQYANKTKEETGKAKWAVRKSEDPLDATVIDVPLLEKRIEIVEGDQRKLECVQLNNSIDVFYEDIADDAHAVFRKISAFLDKPANSNFEIPFRKATPDDLTKAVKNLEEVNRWLVSSGRREIACHLPLAS